MGLGVDHARGQRAPGLRRARRLGGGPPGARRGGRLTRLALIADTHLPRGRRSLPASCLAHLRAADAIVHAGDLSTAAVLEELEALGPPVHAVRGNVDDAAVRARLPEVTEVPAGEALLVVVHDAGPARGRLARLRRRFPTADAVIFGHSHIPLHEQAQDGFQIFNPGSPTERRRQPRHTMGLAEAESGAVGFTLVDLD
ncbi:MAG TPA: metallophosphoesterase family protein [Solirubrobacteraceae bacterium]|nr:metallophosphoesterase family protein [Solirubrobacteraceae bacterium]